MINDFLTLGIRQELNNYLRESGITKPTPIQERAIPVLMAGKDLVAEAQTGTGKTFAFLLPVVEAIDVKKHYVQALILTPTRELALQIAKEAKKLADILGITVLAVYGGHALQPQINRLKEKPQLVIGTPGRLLDHLRRKTLIIAGVSRLVLDEADQMLHMGFLDEVETIIRQTPDNRQTMLFSATIPPQIRRLAARYMKKPADIRLQTQNVTLDEIRQIVVETTQEEKLDKLSALIDEFRPYLAMVFCHTKERVGAVALALAQRGYEVDEVHGNLSQNKRERVMQRFRDAKIQILVVTDIAARGLDIEGVTHIFNYDIPHDVESYIHRIGRTGRAGETGTAVTFVIPQEMKYLRKIEQGIRSSIKKQKLKKGTDLSSLDDVTEVPEPAASSRSERAERPVNKPGGAKSGRPYKSKTGGKGASSGHSRSGEKPAGRIRSARKRSG
ncbi:dead/deah box helicase [Lucifera butyrica]|uniref:Dead/deah box helicase n=1 Tax=Lucifera butyrica TaxID=1351585 RepID=A0A498RFK7_9FIRM|nr:DEAD/DEAH box helicase [Lucifera butyrica]VBB09737.1 dead/deah box helicase [Lucifera butyrica]